MGERLPVEAASRPDRSKGIRMISYDAVFDVRSYELPCGPEVYDADDLLHKGREHNGISPQMPSFQNIHDI